MVETKIREVTSVVSVIYQPTWAGQEASNLQLIVQSDYDSYMLMVKQLQDILETFCYSSTFCKGGCGGSLIAVRRYGRFHRTTDILGPIQLCGGCERNEGS